LDCSLDIDGVPERDCGCNEGECARAVALLLETTVSDLSKTAEEDRSCERVAGFSLVETGINASPKIDTLQLGEDEQSSFDATQLAQRDREAILARVGVADRTQVRQLVG
jgi:hypothetical protein